MPPSDDAPSSSPVPPPARPLGALPTQPSDVPWPTTSWAHAPADDRPEGLAELVEGAFAPEAVERLGTTSAVLVVHRGRLVIERYADGTDATTPMRSWSIAKSVLNGLTGVLVRDGLVRLDDPILAPEWPDPDDPRRAITVDDALHMRTGLAWNEDYVDEARSTVIPMLYGAGRSDTAGWTARQPLAHPPGSTFCYASGTSNLLSAHLGRVLADTGRDIGEVLRQELLEPIGIHGARLKFDEAGTWIASTYCGMTARDDARLGLLYLRDGMWDGHRVLPAGWVDATRDPQPDADDDGWGYGRHWWTHPELPEAFFASGFLGQRILVVPPADLVVVRLGESVDRADPITAHLFDLVRTFAPGTAGAPPGHADR